MHTKNTPLLAKLFSLLSCIFILQGCGPGKSGIWKDAKIKSGVRDEMHVLNDTLLNTLKDNRYKALQFILSRDMMENTGLMATAERLSVYSKRGKFSLLREYYVVGKPGTSVTISERELGINNYDIHFHNEVAETYLAFFVQKGLTNQRILTAVYNKFDYGWKLSSIDVNQYTFNGKTAPELFEQAMQRYNKGYLVDAVNLMSVSSQCAVPTDSWEYQKSSQMAKFHGMLLQQANAAYKFPYMISGVSTHPQLFSIATKSTDEGQFPQIYYLSKIKLKDTVAIKKENEEIKKAIGKVMPGINADKKYVFYSAFNEKPNPKTSVDHFDMTDKLQ
jgi:hypothetical protein